MSSLMQHGGRVDRRGVGLLLYLTDDGKSTGKVLDLYLCAQCGKQHEVLNEAFRKPCGMLGCWVQFRMHGKIIAPDLSIPMAVAKLPRDARRLTDEEATKYWHST